MRRVWNSINWRLLIVIIACGAFGDSMMGLLPVFAGAAMDDLGISHSAAGLIISAELLALSATLAIATPFTGIVFRRRLAYRAYCVIAVGALLSIFAESYSVIVAARFVTGLGEGIMMALGIASLAATREPDRLMSQTMAFGVLSGALLMGVMPLVAAHFGLSGVYAGHFIYVSLFIPILWLMPAAPREGAHWRTALHGVSNKTGSGKRAFLPYIAIGGMVCVVIVETAAWSFLERKGVALGLSPAQIGQWLAIMCFAMLIGAIISAVIGTRFGRVLPYLVGGVLLVVGLYISIGADTIFQFVVGLLVWNIAWMFLMPFYMGVMSSLDHEGRWASMSSTILQFTNVFGPLLGGAILGSAVGSNIDGFELLASTTAIVSAIGILIVAPMMVILGRKISAADAAEIVTP